MKKVNFLFLLVLLCGCGFKHALNINPALANISPGQDANAVKVQGDIAPIKAPVQAEAIAQPVIGSENRATNVGRDYQNKEVTVNDSKIIEQNNSQWYKICGLLIMLLIREQIQSALLYKRILAFMNKQEDSQGKYIDALEKIAFKREGV